MKPRFDKGVIVDFKKDVREELGYSVPEQHQTKRPAEPWNNVVKMRSKTISARESPLKEWWLEKERKRIESLTK